MLWEIQSVSSRIWTRVAVSNSYDDNHYPTGTSFNLLSVIYLNPVTWLNSYIWPIDKTLSGATTSGQSGIGNNGNELLLQIPQSSRARASPSGGLASYPGRSLVESIPLQRCSRCILQSKSTGLRRIGIHNIEKNFGLSV